MGLIQVKLAQAPTNKLLNDDRGSRRQIDRVAERNLHIAARRSAALISAPSKKPILVSFQSTSNQVDPHRQIRTGSLLCVTTWLAWLPITIRDKPWRPCDAITIRSQLWFSATLRMPSAG